MKIRPIGDRIVLQKKETEKKTVSGIILTGEAHKDSQIAEVIAVGSGMVDGKEIKMEVEVGDKVIYDKFAGNSVKIDEEEYIVIKQSDIIGVIE